MKAIATITFYAGLGFFFLAHDTRGLSLGFPVELFLLLCWIACWTLGGRAIDKTDWREKP